MQVKISKGTANNACTYNSDTHNISNTNNQIIFGKIVSNKVASPVFDYLMNYQTFRINDIRSILEYNYGNISLAIAESAEMEEIEDEYVVYLTKVRQSLFKKISLIDSLEKRKSIRDFWSGEISTKKLSVILQYSFGVKKEKQRINGYDVPKRYYGSGGGLYPVTPYIWINKVKNLEAGIYKYQPFSHTLRKIEHDEIKMEEVFKTQTMFEWSNVSFGVVFVYSINKNYTKYGENALAHAFIETGLMSQNFHLVAQQLGIGTCDIGGFSKTLIEKRMHLCGVNRHVIYSLLAGKVEHNVEI